MAPGEQVPRLSVEGANGHCGPADVHLPASALPAHAALAFAHEGGHQFHIFYAIRACDTAKLLNRTLETDLA